MFGVDRKVQQAVTADTVALGQSCGTRHRSGCRARGTGSSERFKSEGFDVVERK
jgi:hypothetical protein